jgi:hypothetical protein
MAGVSRRGFRRGNADTLERKGQSGHHHYDAASRRRKGCLAKRNGRAPR